jgi:LuxR family maltose regulon positive regulatory protein
MLLKTKLHLPKPAINPVKRPEVLRHFRLDRRFTTLIAPAGYGKTSIVMEWLESSSATVGWLSLDERDDNEVDQFIQYLLAACGNAATEIVELLSQVNNVTCALSIEYVLSALINIFVDVSKPFILVLLAGEEYSFGTNICGKQPNKKRCNRIVGFLSNSADLSDNVISAE